MSQRCNCRFYRGGLNIKLFEHQVKVLAQTKEHNKVAYYLDMGLGKTFVGSEKLIDLNTPYNLLICPKSKIDDWKEHFIKYYELDVIVYNKPQDIKSNSIIIINYDKAFRRLELLQLKDFTLMLDESSYIKNESAKRTKFILKLQPKNVILLSGTPTGGKYEELWSQLHLLGWSISKKLYYKHYIITDWLDGIYVPIIKGYKNVERLKDKLREHGAIFMKTEEVIDLPQQVDIPINIKNTSDYRKFNKNGIININNNELVGDMTLTKLLYLRQLAGFYNKNKLNKLKEILSSTEDRVIVFYNFKQEYEAIKVICEKLSKPISIINGEIKDLANYDKFENTVVLIQYQAGSMGINLQKSNKIIYFTLPLSSEMFEQSKKRTHRIGQERTCFYYYLITQNTVEEKILSTLEMRKDYTDKLFKESEKNE